MKVYRWASGSRRSTSGLTDPTTRCHIPEDLSTQKHRCENHKYHNKPTVLQDRYTGVVTSRMWRQCYNSVLEKTIRQSYNVKLHTELLLIEFNTSITLTLAMNYTDLVSAGVGHNHGSLPGIVNVGVNIHARLCIYILELQVQQELVQLYCCGCGQRRQDRTADKTFAKCLVKQMVIEGWSFQGGQY
jgi:hypothetical protein